MKKSIFLVALGLGIGAASGFGQGYVFFTSYTANNGVGATTRIWGSYDLLPAGFNAGLFYALGTVSDPVDNGSWWSMISPPTGLADLGVKANYLAGEQAGYFDGARVAIPGYVGGPITFEVVAYNGSSFANSTRRGRSGSFTMNSIATGWNPAPCLGDNGSAMPNFFVPTPEPTTLTLAGLGGLMALEAMRRKQVQPAVAKWKI